MKRLFRRFRYSLLAVVLTATACSGGASGSFAPRGVVPTSSPSGATPAPNVTTAPSGQVRVTAAIANGGLPLLSAKSRAASGTRRRAISSSYQSLVFSGTIYPGYAGTTTQTAVSTLNTTTLPSSVGLAFSSVPAGNNEWVVITVTAYTGQNGTGSATPAGELGGLFNVGSSASVTVDNGSTLRLQLALAGMMDGIISTYELANQTSLDSDLGNFIGQSGASADSTTSLYSNTTLTQLLDNLVSSYARQLTIKGSINNLSTAYATWDYTNASELNYSTSLTESAASLTPFDVSLIHFPAIVGNPNAGLLNGLAAGVPPHVPSAAGSGLQRSVISDGFDAPSGSATVAQVYGGALLVGVATNNSNIVYPTFAGNGGFASVAGRARNSSATANVSVAGSILNINQNDPEAYYVAYELELNQILPYSETFAPIDNVFTMKCHSSLCRGSQSLFYSTTAPGSGTTSASVDLELDQFNPWALPTSKMALCVPSSGECFPLNVSSFTSHLPFYSDTRYAAWPAAVPASGAGATTAVSSGIYDPYKVSYTETGGQANGYISITLGSNNAYFYGGQQLNITTNAPIGSTIYFDIGCGGTTYQTTSIVSSSGNALVTISSISGLVACQSVTIGYSILASSSGSFTLGPILPPAGS